MWWGHIPIKAIWSCMFNFDLIKSWWQNWDKTMNVFSRSNLQNSLWYWDLTMNAQYLCKNVTLPICIQIHFLFHDDKNTKLCLGGNRPSQMRKLQHTSLSAHNPHWLHLTCDSCQFFILPSVFTDQSWAWDWAQPRVMSHSLSFLASYWPSVTSTGLWLARAGVQTVSCALIGWWSLVLAWDWSTHCWHRYTLTNCQVPGK